MSQLLRSVLYVPAMNPRAMQKALGLPVDAVVFDLEDSILETQKDEARVALQKFLSERQEQDPACRIVIRINSIDSGFWEKDLELIKALRPAAVLLPKVISAATIQQADRYLNDGGVTTKIWIMVENPMGILKLDQIVEQACGHNLECLVLGTNDLIKDTDIDPGENRINFGPWFARVIMVAKSYNLPVIDGVMNDFHDTDGLEKESRLAKGMGMAGKTIIHPKQVDTVNTVFSPTAQELAWWNQIVLAYQLPENINKGVINVDGVMVERLHLESAQKKLQLFSTAETRALA